MLPQGNAEVPEWMGKWRNKLIYGDNLSRMRECVAPGSVDLVYLDPPFNSNQSYNVIFKEKNGEHSASQRIAFRDTWKWGPDAIRAYEEIVETGPKKLAKVMQAFKAFLDGTNLLAYLSMMAPRLLELRHVLKENGSLYLHCDPNASHYLKLLLDSIFGPENFRNEIVWKRTPFSGSSKALAKQFPKNHDVILFYSASAEERTWSCPTIPYSAEYLKRFKWKDDRGYYRKTLLKTFSQATFDRLKKEDRLVEPVREGAKYSYKQYLLESSGKTQIDDVWTDINMLNPVAKERVRVGYPTQKPEALLERILLASSREGDLILDPFCGCGTAIAVAQHLKRRWIGIDITQAAIKVIKGRLIERFPDIDYDTSQSEPVSVEDALALAEGDPYEFQWWIVQRVEGDVEEKKKGADRGIDGRIYFHDDLGNSHEIICSVKAGQQLHVNYVRDLRGVIEREKAAIGVLLCAHEPTGPMLREAAEAGEFKTKWGESFPRLQILTVKDIMIGQRTIERPRPHGKTVAREMRTTFPARTSAQIKLFK